MKKAIFAGVLAILIAVMFTVGTAYGVKKASDSTVGTMKEATAKASATKKVSWLDRLFGKKKETVSPSKVQLIQRTTLKSLREKTKAVGEPGISAGITVTAPKVAAPLPPTLTPRMMESHAPPPQPPPQPGDDAVQITSILESLRARTDLLTTKLVLPDHDAQDIEQMNRIKTFTSNHIYVNLEPSNQLYRIETSFCEDCDRADSYSYQHFYDTLTTTVLRIEKINLGGGDWKVYYFPIVAISADEVLFFNYRTDTGEPWNYVKAILTTIDRVTCYPDDLSYDLFPPDNPNTPNVNESHTPTNFPTKCGEVRSKSYINGQWGSSVLEQGGNVQYEEHYITPAAVGQQTTRTILPENIEIDFQPGSPYDDLNLDAYSSLTQVQCNTVLNNVYFQEALYTSQGQRKSGELYKFIGDSAFQAGTVGLDEDILAYWYDEAMWFVQITITGDPNYPCFRRPFEK